MSSPEQILNVLSEITETDEVRRNPDLPLYDLQILDSMRTVELLLAVARDLGIEISPAEFDRDAWATPGKFVADLLSRSAAAR
jgi:D-alanine--poly(phosphoribitol) ligase subunit 2